MFGNIFDKINKLKSRARQKTESTNEQLFDCPSCTSQIRLRFAEDGPIASTKGVDFAECWSSNFVEPTLFVFGKCPKCAVAISASIGENGDFSLSQNNLPKPDEEYTELMYASTHGDIERVRRCIEENSNVNIHDEQGMTALMYSVSNYDPTITEMLIEAGADVNARCKYGITALMRTAGDGDKYTTKLLIEVGADANAEDLKGNSALRRATIEGHTEIVDLLRAAGAKE